MMTVLIPFLTAVLVVTVICLLARLKFRSSPLQMQYPEDAAVPQWVSDLSQQIVEEGVRRLPGWRGLEQVNVRFCRPETLQQPRAMHYLVVTGSVFLGLPDTMFINAACVGQPWVMARALLHELYHIYEIETLGTTQDPAPHADCWAEQVLREISAP